MPRNKRYLAVPLAIVVSFVLTMFAPPANAAVNPMYIEADCDSGPEVPMDEGIAYYQVVNREADTTISLAYDNGYAVSSAPTAGYLWNSYGDPEPQESSDSAYIKVVRTSTGATLLDRTFDRTPCGDRPTVNHPPVAGDISWSVYKLSEVTLTLLGSDEDPDDVLSYSIGDTEPSHGTVTIDGDLLTYEPDGTYTGVEEFTYRVDDSQGEYAEGTITLDVTDTRVVTPAQPVFHQTDPSTDRASIDIPASDTVQYHVYRASNTGAGVDEGVQTDSFVFSAGETVAVVAEPASEDVELSGTTTWNYRAAVPVRFHPVGKIKFRCGKREKAIFMMDNRASNVAVKFAVKFGNWKPKKLVQPGARGKLVRKTNLKPGKTVKLFGQGQLLVKAKVPKACK